MYSKHSNPDVFKYMPIVNKTEIDTKNNIGSLDVNQTDSGEPLNKKKKGICFCYSGKTFRSE